MSRAVPGAPQIFDHAAWVTRARDNTTEYMEHHRLHKRGVHDANSTSWPWNETAKSSLINDLSAPSTFSKLNSPRDDRAPYVGHQVGGQYINNMVRTVTLTPSLPAQSHTSRRNTLCP